jgi:hypothetical protein
LVPLGAFEVAVLVLAQTGELLDNQKLDQHLSLQK